MTRYLRSLALSFFLILLISGSVSYLLDPFGYFRLNGLRTTSLLGNRVWGGDRPAKALALPWLRPKTLLLGSSRVKLGFDIDDPEIQNYIGNAYSLSITGATIDEIDKYFRYALSYYVPSNIIIGLDFGQFYIVNHASIPAFMEHDTTVMGRISGTLHRLSFALWSKNALMTAATMYSKPHPTNLNGSRNFAGKEKHIREYGSKAKSQKFERSLFKQLKRDKDILIHKERIEILNQLSGYACKNSIRVKLFISPMHIRQLLLLKNIGLQEQLYSWKREVTRITEQYRADGCNIDLVDFSGISEYTTEPFPPNGYSPTSPRWYWESNHYKASLGKLIILRLWDHNNAPHNFGTSLSSATIDREITTSKKELNQYHNSHPELVKELQDNLAQPN